ncbi:MAG: helix-turn-helix transcriptional regulator [Clostridia bacterium]|nr:helix-turn-helix transcriptional regulator [Clostridia bacterium]
MDWESIGKRIRKQREYLGFTREMLAEKIAVTPKFCSDIELGVKGMSVATLCRLSKTLNLSVNYILFGTEEMGDDTPVIQMLRQCPQDKVVYLEEMVKAFLLALQEDEKE